MAARKPHILAEDAGVIAPMAALMMAVMMGVAGLATDSAIWIAQRRNLQSATDAAALAAAAYAGDTQQATAKASAILQANGFDNSSTLVSLTPGYYCPDTTLAPAQRFTTSSTTCSAMPAASGGYNAVRVQTQMQTRAFLMRALGTPGVRQAVMVNTRATAAEINEAGLSAGTGLAAVDPALVNGLLGGLLGVNLSVASYSGLANANIDALSLFNALATQVGVSAGTYSQLAQTNVTVGQVVAAEIAALQQQGSTASAAISILQTLQTNLGIKGNTQVTLSSILDLGLSGTTPVGSTTAPAALHAGLNPLQLLLATVELANGSNALSLNAGLPANSLLSSLGLSGLTVAATAIEPPQFVFGPAGVSVHSAQVRLQLNLNIPSLGGIIQGQIPLYIESGAGDAQIASISCSGAPTQDAQVGVNASTGLLNIYLGTAPTNLMSNFSQPVSPSSIQPATLLGLNLLGIVGLLNTQAKAEISVSPYTAPALLFSQPTAETVSQPYTTNTSGGIIGTPPWSASPGVAGTPVRISSGISLSSTLGNLLAPTSANANALQVQVCVLQVLGACVGQSTLSGQSLGNSVGQLYYVLEPILAGLDSVTQGLLATLGVNIGYMDTEITGVRCGVPALVA